MTDSALSPSLPDTPFTLPVDPEHGGIRAVGCFTFLLASATAFILLGIVLSGAELINVLLALLIGAFVAYVVDHWLKRHWPSGRRLVVEDSSIQVVMRDKIEMQVDPQRLVNIMPWRFTVKRNGRIKKGWYVIALGLEQDDMILPVYTFAPPDEFEKLPLASHFTALQREDPNQKESSAVGSARELKAAGQQRRLHDAEKARGMMGAEVTLEQFEAYLRALQDRFPQWMPQK